MESETQAPAGFTPAEGSSDLPEIGVGMLGYAFMGKAHANGYKKIPHMLNAPPAAPELVALCGRSEGKVAEATRRYGYDGYYTDWRAMVEDPRVDLFDNGGANPIHAEPSIAAAEAGKHVLCEKPMARTAEEARPMLEAARENGVKHMVAFNYRFVPALRYLRHLIEEGHFGEIYHFRAVYLQDWLLPVYGTKKNWRLDKETAGSGALGDLGSHIIDLARFLVGEIEQVQATASHTFVEERPLPGGGTGKTDADDAFVSTVTFENGAIGTLEGSRMAAGRKNHQVLEINAEKGSARFNLERMNELEVFWADEEPPETQGFRDVLVTDAEHPWIENWWPPGHLIGWEHTFVHELAHLLRCIAEDEDVAPYGATFEDGYRACVISDAILESADTGRAVNCTG